jgi:hypothetical protein
MQIDPNGEQAIQQIVARGDLIEHPGHLLLFGGVGVLIGDDGIVWQGIVHATQR